MAEKKEAFADEAISAPPFVDEPENDEKSDQESIAPESDKSDDKGIDPLSEEGSSALVNNFEDTLSDKIDRLTNKIDDLMTLNKVDKLIDSLDNAFEGKTEDSDSSPAISSSFDAGAPDDLDAGMDAAADTVSDLPDDAISDESDEGSEGSTTEQASIDKVNDAKDRTMAMTKKRATDDNGNITDATTADEVLNKLVDQDNDYDQAMNESKSAPTPDSANVGDNKAGNDDTVSESEDLKPVTTASAMRLADSYIKAGVIAESERWAAAEKLSKLSKIAARNRQMVFDAIAKTASIKVADEEDAPVENATPVYDLDGLEAGTITPTDDGYAYDIDGATGEADSPEEALEAAKDETGNDDLVTSEAIASRRRARLRKNLKIAARTAARIQAADRRKAAAHKASANKLVAKKASTDNDLAAARKAALAAARKKAAVKTPRIARATAAPVDDSMALI